MMMMRAAVRTFLWTAFLHFLFTAAEHVKDISPSSVLRREKREWKWNTFHTSEEKPPQLLPETIGKLKNTLFINNAEFKLSGEGAGDIFSVNKAGEVLVLKKLDRERVSSYTLTAHLIDPKSGMKLDKDTEFIIKVDDINDNPPQFSDTIPGSVIERANKGVVVLTVHATDKDDPNTANGIVTYSLLNGTDFFSINSENGKIYTKVDTLDRETQSEYKLVVQASDMPGVAGGRSVTTTATITITDANDNHAAFSKQHYHFNVNEDAPVGSKFGILDIIDRDEKQNKKPKFAVDSAVRDIFDLELNDNNDGVLVLKQDLDYEKKERYTFTVTLTEDVVQPPDNSDVLTRAQVHITVKDVDESPVFTQAEYIFKVYENKEKIIVGSVSAKDTDKTNHRIRYSIKDPTSPVNINSETGQLTLKNTLDREAQNEHKFFVTAEEESPNKLNSYTTVKLIVLDVNDNIPELANGTNVYICENDQSGTVIGVIGATDKDENPGKFRFSLRGKSSNFSLYDNLNNTASIILTHGGFSTERSVENVLEIKITDGGYPELHSITHLLLQVCKCGRERRQEYCQAYSQSRVSVSALIAILLCIITILVIVILFVLRKHYQKKSVIALGKASGEIHEQLMAYDEEGGGEMDTNIYDVSILTSARSDARLGPDPRPPAMYAIVKKPSACKGDMAVMIEVKKDEADHDRDGTPYDTLHIYGYEGSESLAGSLSSLQSSSSCGSDLDYDILNDWGPRFRTLAQIYGSDVNTSY
ncbi:cadherin-5 [Ictalurus furcatus]|uniref:cadherin-5 n=1 Tax=Ictalurus furcatus TaxID=66913 RepID=UPI00235005B3|nr:cadherin-5 [Ictalurus furcatus]